MAYNLASLVRTNNGSAVDVCRVWRYLVTMADEGCELKLWDCTSWTCLQTITLAPCQSIPAHFQVMPCIKAQLDPTASYLVLSDIRRKVCYVLITVTFCSLIVYSEMKIVSLLQVELCTVCTKLLRQVASCCRERASPIALTGVAIQHANNGYSRCGNFGSSLVCNMVLIYLPDASTSMV